MSKIANTVDPRILKDHELYAVAGGETSTNSFQTVSNLLKVRYDASTAVIRSMR